VTQQGDQHSPRVDEQMEREVESLIKGAPVSSRSQDWRDQQPLPEDPGLVAGGVRAESHPASGEEVRAEVRSQVARWLRGASYPAERDSLVALAREQGADDEVLGRLEGLPEGPFPSLDAVTDTLIA